MADRRPHSSTFWLLVASGILVTWFALAATSVIMMQRRWRAWEAAMWSYGMCWMSNEAFAAVLRAAAVAQIRQLQEIIDA